MQFLLFFGLHLCLRLATSAWARRKKKRQGWKNKKDIQCQLEEEGRDNRLFFFHKRKENTQWCNGVSVECQISFRLMRERGKKEKKKLLWGRVTAEKVEQEGEERTKKASSSSFIHVKCMFITQTNPSGAQKASVCMLFAPLSLTTSKKDTIAWGSVFHFLSFFASPSSFFPFFFHWPDSHSLFFFLFSRRPFPLLSPSFSPPSFSQSPIFKGPNCNDNHHPHHFLHLLLLGCSSRRSLLKAISKLSSRLQSAWHHKSPP